MKILHIITKSNWGGAQRHVYDISVLEKASGHEVAVAAGGDYVSPLFTKLTALNIAIHPLITLTRDIHIASDIKIFFELISLLHTEKPDVIHLHSSKIGGLGALAARIVGVKKIVFTAHGTPFKEDRNTLSLFIIKTLSCFTVLLSHKTICVSDAVKSAYPEWLIQKKGVVIHNGIESESTASKIDTRNILSIDQAAFVIGTIAELHPNKGLNFFIDSASEVVNNNSNVQFHILGGGQDFDTLSEKIKQLGLQSSVFLHGFVPSAQQYLSAFDIFVLPSINEGLPYVLLEAGVASRPTIASAVGGIPEVIVDNETGLLCTPKDTADLTRKIELLVSDERLRERLGTALHQRVLTVYSADTMSKKLLSLYQE